MIKRRDDKRTSSPFRLCRLTSIKEIIMLWKQVNGFKELNEVKPKK